MAIIGHTENEQAKKQQGGSPIGALTVKNIAIVVGVLLIVVGLAGYGLPETQVIDSTTGETFSGKRSVTALIPLAAGLPILFCGLWVAVNPAAKKMAMHFAFAFGLLGALAATGRGTTSLLSWIRGDEFNARPFVFVTIMGVLCWMFVIFCVGSFIKARKARGSSPS